MAAALLADSHAGWKGVVIKMSMSECASQALQSTLYTVRSLKETNTSRHAD